MRCILALAGVLLGGLALGIAYWLIAPRLPVGRDAARTCACRCRCASKSADGKLIATFGETRRIPVEIEDVPEQLKQAFLAAEDADFYSHRGIDSAASRARSG